MNPENITEEELKAAGGKIEKTEQWKAASKQLVEERNDEAQAVDAFPDYEELDGVRFYAPTVKHEWALTAFARGDNEAINGMIGGYILATSADNLTRIFVEAKNETLQLNAFEFVSKFNIEKFSFLIAKLCNQADSGIEETEGDPKN